MGGSTITFLIMGALLLLFVARRAGSLINRQKLRPNTMTVRLALFVLLGGMFLVLALGNVPALLGDLGGLAVGAGVAWWGLRLTVFEYLPDGLYYTPNKYIGLGVFVVFLLRLGYRLFVGLSTINSLQGQRPATGINVLAQFSSDPLTGAAYFLLIGYYLVYYSLLLMRYRAQTQQPG